MRANGFGKSAKIFGVGGGGVIYIFLNFLMVWVLISFFFSLFSVIRHLPNFKQRIAGQCLPFEDFAIHKANKYFEQNGRLFLPGVVSILTNNIEQYAHHLFCFCFFPSKELVNVIDRN